MKPFPLIVICGPAGVGKTTVVKTLLKIYPLLHSSVTYTTRQKRWKSTEDKVMHNITIPEFAARREKGEFLEWALVHGDLYGTHRRETENLLETNPVIFNIDVQGAEQIKKQYGERVTTIFLLPESHEQMVSHIRRRGEMTEGSLEERLKSAEKELMEQDKFDHKVVNREGKLNETIEAISSIINSLHTRLES